MTGPTMTTPQGPTDAQDLVAGVTGNTFADPLGGGASQPTGPSMAVPSSPGGGGGAASTTRSGNPRLLFCSYHCFIDPSSGAALATRDLLALLAAGRPSGPLFLTDRRAPADTPARDLCRVTGRGRLSYRRAAELFTAATQGLDDAGRGWTLRQLRRE